MTYKGVSKLTIIDSDNGLSPGRLLRHYMNQCWNIVNWTLENKLQWNCYRNLYTLIKLEQLERLRSEDTPRHLMITHIIESYWIPSQKNNRSRSMWIQLATPLFYNAIRDLRVTMTHNYRYSMIPLCVICPVLICRHSNILHILANSIMQLLEASG